MRTQHNTATALRRWLFLAVRALAALALTVGARPAAAQAGVIQFRSQINAITAVSTCTGGSFLLTGIDHLVFELTLNEAGGLHVVTHQYGQLTGTDNQGNSYIGNLTDTTAFDALVTQEVTRSFTLVAVSRGAAPNFNVHFTLHVTVNADGTVTSSVSEVTSTCQR